MAADAAPGGARRGPAVAPDGPAGTWSRIVRLGSASRSVGALALVALTVLLLVWGPDARLRGLWFDLCQTGDVERLEGGGGPPLCVLEGFPYETATARLRPADTVLLLTDGVTEAIDPRGDLFGTPRVTALVADAARAPTRGEPARLVADLMAAVRTFREPVEPADDVTLLAVQWLGPADAGEPADAGLSAP